MKKQTKLKLLERDVRCLKLLKRVNKAATMLRWIGGAVVCVVVAWDVVRIVKK